MEKMDKGLTVPKWVLIVQPKMPQNLSAQFVCPSPKVLDFNKKKMRHWASVVRVPTRANYLFNIYTTIAISVKIDDCNFLPLNSINCQNC